MRVLYRHSFLGCELLGLVKLPDNLSNGHLSWLESELVTLVMSLSETIEDRKEY